MNSNTYNFNQIISAKHIILEGDIVWADFVWGGGGGAGDTGTGGSCPDTNIHTY